MHHHVPPAPPTLKIFSPPSPPLSSFRPHSMPRHSSEVFRLGIPRSVPNFKFRPGQWGHLAVGKASKVPHPFTLIPGEASDEVRTALRKHRCSSFVLAACGLHGQCLRIFMKINRSGFTSKMAKLCSPAWGLHDCTQVTGHAGSECLLLPDTSAPNPKPRFESEPPEDATPPTMKLEATGGFGWIDGGLSSPQHLGKTSFRGRAVRARVSEFRDRGIIICNPQPQPYKPETLNPL